MNQKSNLALQPSNSLVALRTYQLMQLFPSVSEDVSNNFSESSDYSNVYPILSWNLVGEDYFSKSVKKIIALLEEKRKVSFLNLNGLDYEMFAPERESVKVGCHLMDVEFAEKGLSVVDIVHTYDQTTGGPVWFL
ncbi:MAG: hypothetical protein UZ19_OD1000736 [Parcubacteria bacterium OLB19]|nr:MAG: hypothetical protein UZ19_OD1000736 [Parcubacteria bacterium OLB19]